MNDEKISDADLDAFLRGDDALARELQALEQPAPSAALDAAILAQAERLMADDGENAQVRRPAAANDAGPKLAPWQAGRRWRMPAGIAAALVAVVLAQQTWQSELGIDRVDGVAGLPLPAAPPPSPPSQEASPVAVDAPPAASVGQPPAPAPRAASKRAALAGPSASVAVPAEASPSAPAAVAAKATAPMAPPPPPAPAPADFAARAPAPMAPPAPASAAGISDTAEAKSARAVTVTGRRSRIDVGAAATAAPAGAGAPSPASWLAAIDALLQAGLRRDAVEEWDKFRAAYPDYPVPAATTGQIDALKKQP